MSLITQLPEIVEQGRIQAEEILKNIGSPRRLAVQTAEVVTPAKQTDYNSGLIDKLGKTSNHGGGAI